MRIPVKLKRAWLSAFVVFLLLGNAGVSEAGPIEFRDATLGALSDYLFVFTDGSTDANWEGASKGFVGDVVVDGIQADERTSGTVPYGGTIYTNDSDLDAWQDIVDDNTAPSVTSTQAWGSTGHANLVTKLEADLANAFAVIDGLTATSSFANASGLDGLDYQNATKEVIVIDITDDLTSSSAMEITGDWDDLVIVRWDDDAVSAGYNGQVKFQSGGGIVPLGGLKPSNFIHVAGDINASGGGSNPALPFPQGPYDEYNGYGDYGDGSFIEGGDAWSGGGFFTGYWLTTGDPDNNFETSSLSNAIFAGGWYTSTTKFSMTSGTSGIHVPNPGTFWLLGTGLIGLAGLRRKFIK